MSQTNGREHRNPPSPISPEEIERMQSERSKTIGAAGDASATATAANTVSTVAAPAKTDTSSTASIGPKAEEVWIVRFHEKSHPNDTNDVVLSVNGDMHQQQRGVEGPCPDRFLEVADRAVYPHYKQEPGKQRKIAAHIHRYPYTKIRKSSMDEYRALRAAGTKRNAEYVEKHGMEPPSQG